MHVSEYFKNKSLPLLPYEWAKTGRGDGISWSGIAAPFLSPKKNLKENAKDIVIRKTPRYKHKTGKISVRTPHGNPLRAASPSAALFY
jgi:hypothetical protein